jgi:phosphoserine phosphatase RsbU/P
MIAKSIQMSFLPKIFPPFPDRDEFELYSLLESAKEVGGDLYDFFLIDENRLFFNVGDVSDKGVPAALFMAVTKTLMKSTAQEGRFTPAEILARVNLQLFQQNESFMFVTLFCGILDIRTGTVVYSNAGHNPPIVIRASCDAEWLELPEGLVLGVSDDVKYEDRTLQLAPGDMIVSYTDGVTEAMNLAREQYSEERLVETVVACATECAEVVVKRIKESVSEFAGEATQSDDITILSLRYKASHADPLCKLPE